MINPINAAPLIRQSTPGQNASGMSNGTADQDPKSVTQAELKTQTAKDVVSFSFHLDADPVQLAESINTIQSKIKDQLTRRYGLQGDDASIPDNFLPPENATSQELLDYISPENTASRIAQFATGFFSSYQANHDGEEITQQVTEFSTLVQEAIQKGFQEAEQILGNYDELGEIGEVIQKTYNLVMEEIANFRDEILNSAQDKAGENETSASPQAGDSEILKSGDVNDNPSSVDFEV